MQNTSRHLFVEIQIKLHTKMKYSYLILVLAFFAACNNSENQETNTADSTSTQESAQIDSSETAEGVDKLTKEESLLKLNKAILKVLKEKNYKALTKHIHPRKGLHFSPYAYINKEEDVCLESDELLIAAESGNKLIWGVYDGIGGPIALNLNDFFDKFVYDVDFLNADEVNINKSVASGNSIDNIASVFPKSDYVENYFPGFNKDYAGMDWRALRLVFQEENNTYYLVAILSDQWTT